MTTFQVAHIHEQGQDLIIVLMDRSFGLKGNVEQNGICAALQACASSAGLAETVVPIWDDGAGRMAFRAPVPWHQFFRSLDLAMVGAMVNRTLTCG